MEPVRSRRNRRVVQAAGLRRLRQREATGLTLLEGPHLLEEAVRAGAAVRTVFALPQDAQAALAAERLGAELVVLTREVLDRLAPTDHPRGPVATMAIPPPAPPGAAALLVLWGLRDPGNLGTLVRVAAALAMGVVVGPGSTDPWAPKVLRAAAGGHFRTDVSRIDRMSALPGYRRAALVASAGVAPWEADLAAPCALVVGEEARGLPADVVEACDTRITIPMPGGMESLNAAMAGAMVAYEVLRQGSAGR